jgi:hypothetical protein
VICASEPSTKVKAQWKLIKKNHCVLVDPDGQVREESMDYRASLNALKVTATVAEFVKHLHGLHDRYGNMVNA